MARLRVAEFLEYFVLPLVRGGKMVVSRPLTMDEVDHFEVELAHATVPLVAVDDIRTEVLSELVVRPPALVLDGDELRLAAALYNVLFLIHPEVEHLTLSRRVRARVAETARRLAAQPLSQARTRVLARHGLLHNVFAIQRTDLRVSWWTGSANFMGQEPPSRLVAWAGMRRVRTEVSKATYGDLLHSDEATPIMAILLRRSPLTQLLSTHPQAPPLHWEDSVFVLRDPELARAVAYEALRPEDPDEQLATPARYAAGFEQMLERNPDPADVRAVAAFLVHLAALLALGELRQPDRNARSPLLTTVLAPERAGKRPRGLTTFLALPSALGRVDPRLAQPPGIAEDAQLAARWHAHRAQILDGLGEAVIDTLAERLVRRLDRTRLLPPPVEAADQSS